MARMTWWDGKDLNENGFLEMLMAEGANNLRVEFHHQSSDLVLVDKRTGEVCGTYNQSHTCPPDCP
jgi:hypothetical protein